MTITVFDTLRGQLVPFEPIEEGKVGLYVCGPTVYDVPHIGHARTLIVFDMIVAATHRGRGVGRQVLEELLGRPSLARSAGVELMCLPEMAAYYERFGFRPGDPGVIRMQRPRS